MGFPSLEWNISSLGPALVSSDVVKLFGFMMQIIQFTWRKNAGFPPFEKKVGRNAEHMDCNGKIVETKNRKKKKTISAWTEKS